MRKKETPNPSRVRGRGVEVSETLFYLVIYRRMIYNKYIDCRYIKCDVGRDGE